MTSEIRRHYHKRRRAEHEAATRLRITEAAVRLHGTVGPAQTTIKAIAAEAGVQRSTVYRHYPDLESLFASCSAHWVGLNPPPDPVAWARIADHDERVRRALAELYGWYERAAPMLTNILRDVHVVPEMADAFGQFEHALAAFQAALMRGC